MPENYRSSGVWDSKECVLIVPFLAEIAIQQDIYPRTEIAKAAETRAAEARAAAQTQVGAAR